MPDTTATGSSARTFVGMIDAVDATLARSLAVWESGHSSPVPLSKLEVTRWFSLEEYEWKAVARRPADADLEWLEISVAPMLASLIEAVGVDWASEAATHLAGIIVSRAGRVQAHVLDWGQGTPVSGRVLDILTDGFPHPGLA